MQAISTIEELEKLYGIPSEAATAKEVNYITPEYGKYILASPFVALATSGPEGLDCSPRGDQPGFVRIENERTLIMPDRRGNDRIDSLRNIVRDPRVALLFLIPGVGNTLRINGNATISAQPELLQSFAVDGKAPRSVIVIETQSVYFQCARALIRSKLWDPEAHVDPKKIPTAGQILKILSQARVGGEEYDRDWPERAKKTMW